MTIILTPARRLALGIVALIGLFGPNGVFLYFAIFRWSDFLAGQRHPVAAAFVVEAILVTCLLAAFLAARPIGRWGWKTFIALSLAGGLLFSIPAILLLNERRGQK
jgi:hypothetical protein